MDKKVVYLTVSLGGLSGHIYRCGYSMRMASVSTSIVCGAIGSFIGLYIGIKLMNI